MGTNTPLEALYALFKDEFGLSHRALSQLILSDRPYQNGISPQQMSMNTSWLSRSVVHVPMDSIQSRLFADFPTSSRRVHSRLGQAGRSDAQIYQAICDSDLMPRALSGSDQSRLVYGNVLVRLQRLPQDLDVVKARASLLLTIAVGCTGSIAYAVELTSAFVHEDGRTAGCFTPPSTPVATSPNPAKPSAGPGSIGLVRLVNGYVASNFYIVSKTSAGSIVGALALGEHAIADVDIDVSAEHLRVYYEHGRWLACDLGSKNGTTLLAASGAASTRLAPGTPVELHPGDTLCLGKSTTFVIVAVAENIRGGGSLRCQFPSRTPRHISPSRPQPGRVPRHGRKHSLQRRHHARAVPHARNARRRAAQA